jgi:hypothetical protein
VLRWIAPTALPCVNEFGINPVVLLVTLTISIVTSLLFGLIPALKLHTQRRGAEGGRPIWQRFRWTAPLAKCAHGRAGGTRAGAVNRLHPDGANVSSPCGQVDPGYVRPQEVETFRTLQLNVEHAVSDTLSLQRLQGLCQISELDCPHPC